jgi:hypothetical protein
MEENKEKVNDLLKRFTSFIENIHDNYASIKNLERQKQIADKNLIGVIENQIQEINTISANNQQKAAKILDEIIKLTEAAELPIKESCNKLRSDFEAYRNNPNLLIIQADIKDIKKGV